jgi:hypothetical protein
MNSWIDDLIVFLMGVFALLLCVAIFALPIEYYSAKSKIAEYKSVQTTLENARENKNANPYEIAAIQQKVVDSNKWLANKQYWNDTILGWYIPDEVDDLKPIR